MAIAYENSDATKHFGKHVLAHICNDCNKWGAGFVMAVSNRWPIAKSEYHSMFKNSTPKLGHVQFVEVGEGKTVANMVAQKGIRSQSNPSPISYPALSECLEKVYSYCLEKGIYTVAMPKIGTGLANGKWELILPIIKNKLEGIDVIVYER